MKIRPHYYAAIDPDGYLLPWMTRAERRSVVRAVERCDYASVRGKSWRRLYREGWRVIRVRIVAEGVSDPKSDVIRTSRPEG